MDIFNLYFQSTNMLLLKTLKKNNKNIFHCNIFGHTQFFDYENTDSEAREKLKKIDFSQFR